MHQLGLNPRKGLEQRNLLGSLQEAEVANAVERNDRQADQM
jgi:hypothetical protein